MEGRPSPLERLGAPASDELQSINIMDSRGAWRGGRWGVGGPHRDWAASAECSIVSYSMVWYGVVYDMSYELQPTLGMVELLVPLKGFRVGISWP